MTKRLQTPATGSGRSGTKRHQRQLRPACEVALSHPAIRRLARRGGVKRIGGGTYEEVQRVLRGWLAAIVSAAATFTEHRHSFTVSLRDMLCALKHHGVNLYGFEEKARRRRRMLRPLQREELAAAQESVLARRAAEAGAAETSGQEAAARGGVAEAVQSGEQEAAALAAEPAPELATEPAAALEPELAAKPAAGKEAGAVCSPAPEAASPGPLTPERSLEIQRCLNEYRESLERDPNFIYSDPEVPVPRVYEAVSTQLRKAGCAPPSPLEFETVLTALERQNAIMMVEDHGRPRMLVFV